MSVTSSFPGHAILKAGGKQTQVAAYLTLVAMDDDLINHYQIFAGFKEKFMRTLTTQEIESCAGGVGSGWFDYSVVRNDSGCYQVDINALDRGLIRYEYCPQPQQTTTTDFSISWSLKDRTLDIPGLTEGSIDTGLSRTYYPPTQDGAYQSYRDGERFLY